MPVIFREDINKDQSIAVWKITENEEFLFSKLNPHDQAFFEEAQIINPFNRLQRIAARVLVKELCESNQIAYDGIKRLSSGCPVLALNNGFVSISHSGKFAAIHISWQLETGIDVQLCNHKIHKVAPRIFNQTEIELSRNDLLRLTLLWSAKECIYKMVNIPGITFMKELFIRDIDESNRLMNVQLLHPERTEEFVLKYNWLGNYALVYNLV